MSKKINNENKKIEYAEDKTKYGEFISSFFGWISPSRQKERANELNDMTKKQEK